MYPIQNNTNNTGRNNNFFYSDSVNLFLSPNMIIDFKKEILI